MTLTTAILLDVALAVVLIGSLLLLLGHAVHADRFLRRRHVRRLERRDQERIAA